MRSLFVPLVVVPLVVVPLAGCREATPSAEPPRTGVQGSSSAGATPAVAERPSERSSPGTPPGGRPGDEIPRLIDPVSGRDLPPPPTTSTPQAFPVPVEAAPASGRAAAAPPSARWIGPPVRVVAAGSNHTCAAHDDGTVSCWGANGFGQLGDGGSSRAQPGVVKGLDDVLSVSSGDFFTCALRKRGTVSCWGIDKDGQLGGASTSSSASPAALHEAGVSGVKQISAGLAHVCAVREGGAVVCWGAGAVGQLGGGVNAGSRTPVAVKLQGATSISAGTAHTCALRASGEVACWGLNTRGQLGDGTRASSSAPVTVKGLRDAVQIASGDGHTCAIRLGGQVVCWGSNMFGRLGDGTTDDKLAPTPVSGLADAIALDASGPATCVVRSSGALSCWGLIANELGDRRPKSTLQPKVIAGIDDARGVSLGGHACALRASGALLCWGRADEGQLGPFGAP